MPLPSQHKGTNYHHAGVKCLTKLAVISTHLVRRSMIVDRILDIVSRRLAHFLSAPIKGYRPIVTCDPQCLVQVLRPADILLIEGDSRISSAIRYLTQSTWSHAALYVGRIIDRQEPNGEPARSR